MSISISFILTRVFNISSLNLFPLHNGFIEFLNLFIYCLIFCTFPIFFAVVNELFWISGDFQPLTTTLSLSSEKKTFETRKMTETREKEKKRENKKSFCSELN